MEPFAAILLTCALQRGNAQPRGQIHIRPHRIKGKGLSNPKIIEVVQVVAAPIGRVFALLADTRHYGEIDASGTVRGAEGGTITEVGQVFIMNMHRDDLGHYRSKNTVTEFEPE